MVSVGSSSNVPSSQPKAARLGAVAQHEQHLAQRAPGAALHRLEGGERGARRAGRRAGPGCGVCGGRGRVARGGQPAAGRR